MAGLNTAQIKDRARQVLGREISEQEAQTILGQAWDQSQYGADSLAVDEILRGSSGGSGADQTVQDIINESTNALENEFLNRAQEFDEQNPFSFDEALARASSEERYNPYYEAELGDFISGVERKKESLAGQKDLLTELNQMETRIDKRNMDEAIRQSEQGFAGAGLFFSGDRSRETNLQKISGKEQAQEKDSRFQYNLGEIGRGESELDQSLATQKRRVQAEKETAIQTDISQRKAEELAQREIERGQYIGSPYTTQGVNSLLDVFR